MSVKVLKSDRRTLHFASSDIQHRSGNIARNDLPARADQFGYRVRNDSRPRCDIEHAMPARNLRRVQEGRDKRTRHAGE